MAHQGAIVNIGPVTEAVNDYQFIRDLKRLKELRSFLIQEEITFGPEEFTLLTFGRLNLLQYNQNGRSPTQEECSDVEHLTQVLFRKLSEPLRRRFILGEIPSWMSLLPVGLALVALVALVMAVVGAHNPSLTRVSGGSIFSYYLILLLSLCAIGFLAFICINSLFFQQDCKFSP